MNGQISSGPLRFLLFAGVCAESRFQAGLISKNDLEKIKWHLRERIKPEIDFLMRCFPNAAPNITDWSFDSVGDYWHNNHGHTGDCAVSMATITWVSTVPPLVQVFDFRKAFDAFNFYNIDLRNGEIVYLHRKVVIEKVK